MFPKSLKAVWYIVTMAILGMLVQGMALTSCATPTPTIRPSPPMPTVAKSPSATPVTPIGPIRGPSPTPSRTFTPSPSLAPTFPLLPATPTLGTQTPNSRLPECQHARISRVEPLVWGYSITIFGAVYGFDNPGISTFQWFEVQWYPGSNPPKDGPLWKAIEAKSYQVGSPETYDILAIWDAKKREQGIYPSGKGTYTLRIIAEYYDYASNNKRAPFVLDKECWRQIELN